MTKRSIFGGKGGWKGPATGGRITAAEHRVGAPALLEHISPAKKTQKRSGRAPRPRPDPKPVDDIAGLPAGPEVLGRVIVPFPPVELSPNFRGHWSKRAKVTKNYRRLCWALALEAKLKVPEYAQKDGADPDGKIAVRLDFFPPDRSIRDDDNVPASFKAGRDGIADALKCDDARFQTTVVLHREPRSCVVVTLVPANPNEGRAA